MMQRGENGLQNGKFMTPTPEPWDDCFVDVKGTPSVLWPGAARLTVESDAPYWVVYTEDPEGVCIEPQSAPPNASNIGIEGEHYIEALFTFSEEV